MVVLWQAIEVNTSPESTVGPFGSSDGVSEVLGPLFGLLLAVAQSLPAAVVPSSSVFTQPDSAQNGLSEPE